MVISVYDFEAGRMLELIFISVYYMCVCGHVYVVYEDTNLYNDMGIT